MLALGGCRVSGTASRWYMRAHRKVGDKARHQLILARGSRKWRGMTGLKGERRGNIVFLRCESWQWQSLRWV
jgi:hypothetical protein